MTQKKKRGSRTKGRIEAFSKEGKLGRDGGMRHTGNHVRKMDNEGIEKVPQGTSNTMGDAKEKLARHYEENSLIFRS